MKSSWEQVKLSEDRLLKEQIRDEILAMKPGRELDALVAKKVMGWTFSDLIKSWYPPNLRPENNAYGHKLPNYSTEIEAAWEIVEKLNQDSFIVQVFSGGRLIACRIRNSKTGEEVDAEAKTAPEAICKSALLAVMGVEK